MIIRHFTDNDLYKFTTMNAIQKLYPDAIVRYSFINRGHTVFPDGFSKELREEVDLFSKLSLEKEEEQFLNSKCYYFDPVFIDLLKGFRFNPEEVKINQINGHLDIEVEGLWYRTVLWEVPLLALISELYFRKADSGPIEVEERAVRKGLKLNEIKTEYSDFGTRRRFSFDVHDRVVKTLKETSGRLFNGTSNVYLAMKNNLTPIGTHPHEWFMYHAARYGYRSANARALDAWVEVYRGDLGIALSDTYTSSNFFESFSTLHAKLFDGVRHDSGDPLSFTDKTIEFYKSKRIDPANKTIVFSDSLDFERIAIIKKHVANRIHNVYGIGTNLTNDVGAEPLNIVIKLTGTKDDKGAKFNPVIKLSDDPGKYTGDPEEIRLCKRILHIE
jgi:nicotinate phosphoribosyltransferase